MSERDDDIIEFDFFEDEPDTQQATQRRSGRPRQGGGPPRTGGPRRPTFRGPEGVTPLLRLILLIALAIFVVIVLVFWIQSCRSASKTEAYQDYMAEMKTVSDASAAIGRDLNEQLTTPGTNQANLIKAIEGLTDRHEQVVQNAQKIDEPGPLRDEQQASIEALQFRTSGLNGLAAAFRQTANTKDAARAGSLLAAQAERFVASDVIWDDLFVEPSKTELESQGVTGVAVPDSNFVVTADLASQRSMVALWQRLQGAAEGGTPSGLHGTGIVSTTVLPSGEQLTTGEETVVEATSDLAFRVAVQNSGDSQEVGIKVTLTIQKSPEPITQTKTIQLINSGETKSVTFENLGQPPFGPTTPVKIDVEPVPGEANTKNNTVEYPVVFSLPR
ncbi:MAG TPA: CARDB domain-containing protein [Gaiellaceae bacterium]|nr:CARDB domain-containing protein [Gaiellaceae bacterium]